MVQFCQPQFFFDVSARIHETFQIREGICQELQFVVLFAIEIGSDENAVFHVECVRVDQVVDDEQVFFLSVGDDVHALHVVVFFAQGMDALHQKTMLSVQSVGNELAFRVDLIDDDVGIVLPRRCEDDQLELFAHPV